MNQKYHLVIHYNLKDNQQLNSVRQQLKLLNSKLSKENYTDKELRTYDELNKKLVHNLMSN